MRSPARVKGVLAARSSISDRSLRDGQEWRPSHEGLGPSAESRAPGHTPSHQSRSRREVPREADGPGAAGLELGRACVSAPVSMATPARLWL